jgi:hypothetical protein
VPARPGVRSQPAGVSSAHCTPPAGDTDSTRPELSHTSVSKRTSCAGSSVSLPHTRQIFHACLGRLVRCAPPQQHGPRRSDALAAAVLRTKRR